MPLPNNSILRILYSFVLITAIISVLEASVYAYMHYGLEHGYMIRRFSYYIPCFAIIIYGLTAGLFLLVVLQKSKRNMPLTISKLILVCCMMIAIVFQYFTEIVSDWHLTRLFEDLSKAEYMSSVNFGKLFDIVEHTTFILRWVFIIALLIVFSFQKMAIKDNVRIT